MFTDDTMICGALSDTAIREYWGKGIFIQTEYKTGELAFNLDAQLQPGSIDLRFRNEINRFKLEEGETLSFDRIKKKDYLSPDVVPSDKMLIIQPGEIILTTTLESIYLSEDFAGIITGRSSFARLGLMVQCCQDFINPGLKNSVALQLVNLSPYAIELDMTIPICQLIIIKMLGSPTEGYSEKKSAKYRGEREFIPSRINAEVEEGSSTVQKKETGRKVKNFLHKYIEPFLPTIIGLLFITPFIKAYGPMTIIQIISKVSLNLVILVVILIVYIILKRDDNE